jgi:hypothetical protein
MTWGSAEGSEPPGLLCGFACIGRSSNLSTVGAIPNPRFWKLWFWSAILVLRRNSKQIHLATGIRNHRIAPGRIYSRLWTDDELFGNYFSSSG